MSCRLFVDATFLTLSPEFCLTLISLLSTCTCTVDSNRRKREFDLEIIRPLVLASLQFKARRAVRDERVRFAARPTRTAPPLFRRPPRVHPKAYGQRFADQLRRLPHLLHDGTGRVGSHRWTEAGGECRRTRADDRLMNSGHPRDHWFFAEPQSWHCLEALAKGA